MLQRFNNVGGEAVNDRVYRFIISDESKDRYGTVIKLDGWDLENYNKNGIVAYQHVTGSWDPDYVVGKGRAWVEDGRLMGEVEFEPEGTNRIADKLVKKLQFGSINATSVGFNPRAWAWGDTRKGEDPETLYFTDQELLEFSIVNIPANANAIIEKAYGEFVDMARQEKPCAKLVEAARQYDEIMKKRFNDEFRQRFDTIRFKSI